MDLLLESKSRIAAYLDGSLSPTELQSWLGEASPDASENMPAGRFFGDVWRLISEYGYGHRDERAFGRS
jgi:hypothetical protein